MKYPNLHKKKHKINCIEEFERIGYELCEINNRDIDDTNYEHISSLEDYEKEIDSIAFAYEDEGYDCLIRINLKTYHKVGGVETENIYRFDCKTNKCISKTLEEMKEHNDRRYELR